MLLMDEVVDVLAIPSSRMVPSTPFDSAPTCSGKLLPVVSAGNAFWAGSEISMRFTELLAPSTDPYVTAMQWGLHEEW